MQEPTPFIDRMKRARPVLILTIICLVLAAGTDAALAGGSQVIPGFESQKFPGGPPPFVVQPGGDARWETRPDGTRAVTLTRANGDVFAVATVLPDNFVSNVLYNLPNGDVLVTWAIPDRSHLVQLKRRAAKRPPTRHLASTCADTSYSFIGSTWAGAKSWYIDVSPKPADLTQSGIQNAIAEGHRYWRDVVNSCGVGDGSLFSYNYNGVDNATGYGVNGRSASSFGNTQSLCSSSRGCGFAHVSGGNIVEGDTMFANTDSFWFTDAAEANQWDLRALAGHEVGHTIGFLDRPCTPGGNLMDICDLDRGETVSRKLGIGDAFGVNFNY